MTEERIITICLMLIVLFLTIAVLSMGLH